MVYYEPMTEKEAEEANKYDYEFEDERTMSELKSDLRKALVRM